MRQKKQKSATSGRSNLYTDLCSKANEDNLWRIGQKGLFVDFEKMVLCQAHPALVKQV